MPLRRKTRNLPNTNDKETFNQMSFFEPVYQNDSIQMGDNESDSELSVNGLSQQTFRDKNKDESNETLDAMPMRNSSKRNENNETFDQDQSSEISTLKITTRIQQIQNSIQQAQTMLDSMDKFKHLVPGSHEQCEKLRIIISNLEEQQAGYVNLLNLIAATNEERSALINKISASHRSMPTNADDQSNDDDDDEEEEEEEDEDEDEDLSSRRNVKSPVRPRIESKIGFTPQPIIPATPTVPPTINSSDNEQNNRNDNSNYDSLVGSLKSDTINWKDQQSTSDDEASDAESEKEIERNLMLQKEQLRALQGQKRALLALKKRSEKRLIEQQQLVNKKTPNPKEDLSENDLLSDINHLRDRLKLLRNLYEQKHQVEVQQIKTSSKKQASVPPENRLKSLQHVREQLDELEQIVTYYQSDLMNQQEEETTVYEETPIEPDDAQRLKTLIMQQRKQTSSSITTNNNDNTSKPLDKLSTELAAKRLELEQAKSALSRLQQMVKKIEPDEGSSSIRSTPIQSSSSTKPTNQNDYDHNINQYQYTPKSSQQTQSNNTNTKTSLLSSILSPKPTTEQQKPNPITTNTYADAKMAAQHREIERLIESRQRLHTIKDEIASLHQSMATPPIQSKLISTNETQIDNRLKPYITESKKQTNTYENKLNNSKNIRSSYASKNQEEENDDDDDDDDSELYRFECESGDGEEIDDDDDNNNTDEEIQPRIKQGNFHAPEDIVAEHEQRLLNQKSNSTDDLNTQMSEICRCLSTFIQEQKSFNRHIEEHLVAATSAPPPPPPLPPQPSTSNTIDPIFNQLQQQVLTQGLIVNLNTAYREIAILQSEINTLQSENNRLTSSLSSYDSQYQYRSHLYSRDNSKESIYSSDLIKPIRPQTRSRYDEHIQQQQQQNHILTTNNKFENSSKTSFSSQSTGKQTAIHLDRNNLETTPIKHERNATFTAECLSSPKPIHLRTKKLSDEYNHHNSSKENLSKSFVIRRRPLSSNDNEHDLLKSQLFNYDQKLQQNTFDDGDGGSSSEEEQQINNLSSTIFNIQPSTYYTSTTHDLDNNDIQALDLQIKSIMFQLIPFMRLHINDKFNQSILNHICERILFLFKQQLGSTQLIPNQFSESLTKTIEKYCGTTIRDCAADLIRDISDMIFDELIKYKLYENTNNIQSTNMNEKIIEPLNKQQDEYSNYDSSIRHYTQQTSSNDDGDNENKYQIELAESESRPLMLIGSDEEDNDSDQEENKDSELETAVSRQESNLKQNEIPSSTELHSNGHEYVLVNRSISNDNVITKNDENPNDENQNS